MKTSVTIFFLSLIATLLYMIFSLTGEKTRVIETILMIMPIATGFLSFVGICLCLFATKFHPAHIWLSRIGESIYLFAISFTLAISL
jgi:hypothetical protein